MIFIELLLFEYESSLYFNSRLVGEWLEQTATSFSVQGMAQRKAFFGDALFLACVELQDSRW